MVTRKFGVADIDKIMEQYRPFTVGFEKVFDNLNNVSDMACNYPPYNIIRIDEENFIIEIAGAGFRQDEFNINLVPEGNKLVVQGVQDRGEDKREFLHKGIGARNFTRTFALNDHIEIQGADMINGMLKIFLERIIPEHKKPKKIEINQPSDGEKQFLAESDDK